MPFEPEYVLVTAMTKDISKLSENKISAIKKARNEIAKEVLDRFSSGYPADRSLSSSLRARKFLGSRDRRFISESIFSLFRWWGWIKKCLKAECEIRKLAAFPDLLGNALDNASFINESLEKLSFCELPAKLSQEFSLPISNFKQQELLPGFFTSNLSDALKINDLTQSFQTRPPIWIRTKNGAREKVVSELRRQNAKFNMPENFPNAVKILKSETSLYSMPEFKNGLFEVQDIASQMIGLIAAPKPGEKWLDACAGAGGKTLQMADMMNGKGSILSQDFDEKKIEELKRRTARASLSNVRTRIADASKRDKRHESFFDGVLVDAPCSCSGTWRRNPDGRWRTQESEIDRFHKNQLSILEATSQSVRSGGTLVYATCSVFGKENEGVISEFTASNPSFKLCTFPDPISGKIFEGILNVNPSEMDSDAVFVAKLKRS